MLLKQKEQMSLFNLNNLSSGFSQSEKPLYKSNILSTFEDCHNYIYANEGVLKDKAFREIIKILFIKICLEKRGEREPSLFKITDREYNDIFSNIACPQFENRVKRMYRIIAGSSSLNIWKDGPGLGLKTTAYIIRRLQGINLKTVPGDIAGQAFQTFIHHHQRGERGEFFTPAPVVELAVQALKPKADEKLIDPACGSGGFLLGAVGYIQRESSHKQISHYVMNNVHGVEFNPDVSLTAKLLIEMKGGNESNIVCANAFEAEDQHGVFDIALTNPPFGRRGKVEDPITLNKYDLGKKWVQSDKGSWTERKSVLCPRPPEILFIEKCLKLLKPDGRMAVVIPDGLLQNPSLAFVRHWIKSKAGVVGVISLPQETFIPFGTGVKTSLVFLRKNFQKKTVFFSKINNIGYDAKGNMHYKKQPFTSDNNEPEGSLVLKNTNSDINQVIKMFQNKKRALKESSVAWRLNCNLLKDRWDAEHYSLSDMKMISRLDSSQTLLNFAETVKRKEKFSKSASSLIKYIAISDIDRCGMKIADHQELYTDQLPSRASYKIFEGDILVAVSGANTGTKKQAAAVVTKDYEGSVCSNGFAVLRNIKNINKYFLLAFFKTDIFIKQVRRMMTGHAIPCISLADLGRVIVPVPDKKIQAKIADRAKRIVNLSQSQYKEMRRLKQEPIFGNYIDFV